MKTFLGVLASLGLALAAYRSQAATVTVFAAASLTEALQHIAADYEKESGDRIVFNFAASGTLVRQIESGAELGRRSQWRCRPDSDLASANSYL
jgi:molybdate transport system substrate-binding protein